MAIKHRQTLGNIHLLEVDAAPNGAATSPAGSIAFLDTGLAGPWINVDGATLWTVFAFLEAVVTKVAGQSPYTVALTDRLLLADTGAGDVQFNLPAVATSGGRTLRCVKLAGANTMILEPDGAETINGVASLSFTTQWSAADLFCDGTQWVVTGLARASATEQGAVELATQTETDVGTDTGRAVTPATLAGLTSRTLVAAAGDRVTPGDAPGTAETAHATTKSTPTPAIGQGFRARVRGKIVGSNAGETITIKLKYHDLVIGQIAAWDPTTNDLFEIDAQVTRDAAGAVSAAARALYGTAGATEATSLALDAAVDMTAERLLSVTAQWSAGHAANSDDLRELSYELLV